MLTAGHHLSRAFFLPRSPSFAQARPALTHRKLSPLGVASSLILFQPSSPSNPGTMSIPGLPSDSYDDYLSAGAIGEHKCLLAGTRTTRIDRLSSLPFSRHLSRNHRSSRRIGRPRRLLLPPPTARVRPPFTAVADEDLPC